MKLTLTPELRDRFNAYKRVHAAWGSLHIVLDDGNYATHSVESCVRYAGERGDVEGEALAKILVQLSITQRKKLAQLRGTI